MRTFYIFGILLIISFNAYSQETYPVKSIKNNSGFVRINTLNFKKIEKIDLFKLSADTISIGDDVTLSWITQNTSRTSLEVSNNEKDYTPLDNSVKNGGTLKLTPKENSFYRIQTDNISRTIRLIVKDKYESTTPEFVYFKINKEKIKKGEKVRLSWLIKNVNRVSLEIGKTSDNTIPYQDYLNEGFVDFSPEKSIYYVIRFGDTTKSLKIEVVE